jgi:ABC-type transporter MlaC component
MLLSIMLTFASLAPAVQAQAKTQVTKNAHKLADHLGFRPAASKDRMQEQVERTKARANLLEANLRKLEARLLESQKILEAKNDAIQQAVPEPTKL